MPTISYFETLPIGSSTHTQIGLPVVSLGLCRSQLLFFLSVTRLFCTCKIGSVILDPIYFSGLFFNIFLLFKPTAILPKVCMKV